MRLNFFPCFFFPNLFLRTRLSSGGSLASRLLFRLNRLAERVSIELKFHLFWWRCAQSLLEALHFFQSRRIFFPFRYRFLFGSFFLQREFVFLISLCIECLGVHLFSLLAAFNPGGFSFLSQAGFLSFRLLLRGGFEFAFHLNPFGIHTDRFGSFLNGLSFGLFDSSLCLLAWRLRSGFFYLVHVCQSRQPVNIQVSTDFIAYRRIISRFRQLFFIIIEKEQFLRQEYFLFLLLAGLLRLFFSGNCGRLFFLFPSRLYFGEFGFVNFGFIQAWQFFFFCREFFSDFLCCNCRRCNLFSFRFLCCLSFLFRRCFLFVLFRLFFPAQPDEAHGGLR